MITSSLPICFIQLIGSLLVDSFELPAKVTPRRPVAWPAEVSAPGSWYIWLFMIPQQRVAGRVVVDHVIGGSLAELAGLLPGDVVIRADGQRIETAEHLSSSIDRSGGSDMEWRVLRPGRENVLSVKPQINPSDGLWAVGISTKEESYVESQSVALWTAVAGGFEVTWAMLVLVEQHFSSAITNGDLLELSGPIGIAHGAGVATREFGLTGWLMITAFLSLNGDSECPAHPKRKHL